ncbi:DNA-binding response regulator [Paracoccus sp. MBLB3053]|uniref:DNA-binding response regulator n=1 Tax=Paracoccus aurantius TaxID=3073814 RepID=A0ABU2HWN9_9RHOB|nr:DNA-binding response regulator [Paracoccus sp. MBLB3053]MDS9468980.1 DNA-binding response regulator [Paracoccus sp. MBLB3053]
MSSMNMVLRQNSMPADETLRSIALVVDDDPASLLMVAEAVEQAGITAMAARDGESALRLAGRVVPDVILLDAMMPGLDGFQTCRLLKAHPTAAMAPVIFMTGLGAPEHILEGLRAGGVDYVTKPLNLDELMARISIHLMNAQKLTSARQALDANGRAVAAFSVTGELAWASPRASDLLAEMPDKWMAPGGMSAAGELFAWLASLRRLPLSQAQKLVSAQVELTYLGRGSGQDLLIAIQDCSGAPREEVLSARFGLTDREAEVLFWLAQGKSNADIGSILGLSGRTVSKHLEQVFEKMGVDNRTSAAVLADRAMGGQ